VTAVSEPDDQAAVEMEARQAAANSGMLQEAAPDQGPHLVEPEDADSDDDVSIIDVADGAIGNIAIEIEDIEDGSVISEDQGAVFDHEGVLEQQEAALDTEDESAEDEGEHSDGGDDGEGVLPRRSKRNRKISTRLRGYEHNVFAMYDREEAEREVDEYMHATVTEDQCNMIDSYLMPVFEFIVTQYSLKAGLEKAKGKDKEAIRNLTHQHMMTQYSLKAGLKKFGKQGLQSQESWDNFKT
jgi:hypothetical protein